MEIKVNEKQCRSAVRPARGPSPYAPILTGHTLSTSQRSRHLPRTVGCINVRLVICRARETELESRLVRDDLKTWGGWGIE